MEIRLAQRHEIKTLVDFQLWMAKETENLELDADVVRSGVEAVFCDKNKGEYWVAVHQERVIASLLLIPEWSDWRNGTVLWIHSVYVMPTWRKKGLFKKMYVHLQDMVNKSIDLRGLRLYVDRSNKVAQKVYQSLGMSNEHYELYEWLK